MIGKLVINPNPKTVQDKHLEWYKKNFVGVPKDVTRSDIISNPKKYTNFLSTFLAFNAGYQLANNERE